VAFPTVEAFSLESDDASETVAARLPRPLDLRSIVRKRSLPRMVERLSVLYETENIDLLDNAQDDSRFPTVPFHAIDTKGFIENNDNRYLLAGITKQEDEVYLFKFKSPSYTTGPLDINQTDVRYWSFNLGNAATYNFNALKDEDAIINDDGYVYIVLSDEDSEVRKLAASLGYNFMEWNMPWKKALILFRHMLADSGFEAQIEDVPPIKPGSSDFTSKEAQLYMGAFAPHGERMSRSDFLAR